MKRILVISDSHHSEKNLIKVFSQLESVDMILHLGDNFKDCEVIRSISNVELYGVLGNCDINVKGLNDQIVTVEDKKIFMTHGHNYNVKYSLDRLYYKALEIEADIVLFGHTHQMLNVIENNIVFFNPGSITSPRGSKYKTYGIIEIDEGKVEVFHKRLND